MEDAVELLARHGEEAVVLAGGQSLVPMMNLRLAQPSHVIDISGLPCHPITYRDGSLVIPALTRHAQLESDEGVRVHAPMLSEAARLIGNVRVRARGTIGGSLAHADPSAELPCALTAMGGRVSVQGPRGKRVVPISELFVGHFTTVLSPDELIDSVEVPVAPQGAGQAFVEFSRRAHDFAVVTVAAVVHLDPSGRCRAVALSYGGVGDRPIGIEQSAGAALVGHRPTRAVLQEVARAGSEGLDPSDDVQASAGLRLHLANVLGVQALERAVTRAEGGKS